MTTGDIQYQRTSDRGWWNTSLALKHSPQPQLYRDILTLGEKKEKRWPYIDLQGEMCSLLLLLLLLLRSRAAKVQALGFRFWC